LDENSPNRVTLVADKKNAPNLVTLDLIVYPAVLHFAKCPNESEKGTDCSNNSTQLMPFAIHQGDQMSL
jgi:hypothetical protein